MSPLYWFMPSRQFINKKQSIGTYNPKFMPSRQFINAGVETARIPVGFMPSRQFIKFIIK